MKEGGDTELARFWRHTLRPEATLRYNHSTRHQRRSHVLQVTSALVPSEHSMALGGLQGRHVWVMVGVQRQRSRLRTDIAAMQASKISSDPYEHQTPRQTTPLEER